MAEFLVTGATGLVGNNVVRILLEQGRTVRVLRRENSSTRPFEGLTVETAIGDIRDPATVRNACRDVSTVIHAAGQVHIGRTGLAQARDVNVTGTLHVADAAQAVGARMIHVSSVDALGLGSRDVPADEETPLGDTVLCPYVVTKREAEAELLHRVADGLDAVIVNPGCMLGPWDWSPSSGRMLLSVVAGKAAFAPRGANSYAHVVDVAAGIVAAAERGQTGRRYILAGESLDYFEAWTILAEVTGARKPICRVGPLIMILAGAFADLRTKISGHEGDINSASIAMSRLPKYYSSDRAQRELGYQSRSLRQAATDAWDWFQRFGYVK